MAATANPLRSESPLRIQQETLTDGVIMGQILFADHVQIGGFWVARSVTITNLELLSGRLVPVSETTLEMKEISSVEATQLLIAQRSRLAPPRRALKELHVQPNPGTTNEPASPRTVLKGNVRDENEAASAEAHHAERDGYIGVLLLPQDLPTVTAARKALEENSAGFAEKISRVFELAQQARWGEALPWQREIDETHISALHYLAKSTMFDKLPTRQQHHAAGECSVKAKREMIEDLSRRLRQLRRKLRN